MADTKIEKSFYGDTGSGSEKITIRTMKRDIERLRQGLPLTKYTPVITEGPTAPKAVPRQLAPMAVDHRETEKLPPEAATPRTAHIPKDAGGEIEEVSRSPIETLRPQARPEIPQTARRGTIVVEGMPTQKGPDIGEETAQPLTILARIFPSRRRLIGTVLAAAIIGAGGAYALFAYFGKPLPGTRYVFESATPSAIPAPPSPTSEPTPTPTLQPSPLPTPFVRTPHLPISRLAIISLMEQTTQLDFMGRMEGFAEAQLKPGDFLQIVVRRSPENAEIAVREFFSLLGVSAPQGFFDELSSDLTVFLYAPRNIGAGGQLQKKVSHIGLLVPVTGSVKTLREKLALWETTLGGDIAPLALGRQWMPGGTTLFESNNFQGTLIRYQNFPDPYLAADYAVFEGSDPPLFILTTSRESIYAVIGTLNYQSE